VTEQRQAATTSSGCWDEVFPGRPLRVVLICVLALFAAFFTIDFVRVAFGSNIWYPRNAWTHRVAPLLTVVVGGETLLLIGAAAASARLRRLWPIAAAVGIIAIANPVFYVSFFGLPAY
jgi:hypothetical protein